MTQVQYGDGWEINLKNLIKWIKRSTKNHQEVMDFDTVELVDEIKKIIYWNSPKGQKKIQESKTRGNKN